MLAQRNGAVLCASTILKADNYPSLQSTRLPQPIDGAPNFRQAAAGLPVFGAGISTLLGVQRVLQATGSGPVATAARAAEQRQTVWHNLREEPVLFLNGTPYVLREAAGAYTNMKEYSGIDAARLEALEERLRAEVLQEAAALGGKVQVLYEEMIHSVRPCAAACCVLWAGACQAVCSSGGCSRESPGLRGCGRSPMPALNCMRGLSGMGCLATVACGCRGAATRTRSGGGCRRASRSCSTPRA